ncbi:unnamed protein product [marine sediment metagenome]|uniref:PD-(D/E)XK endonuclease-like domain-containing protein n=1 Tax=marine sediment metagenome TaxID=412755 RepID=X1SWC2_9ZZZZ
MDRVDRQRFYTIDNQRFPSVTTVLGVIKAPGLEHWRGELGNVEADRIAEQAADVGRAVHHLCHLYNTGQPFTIPDNIVGELFSVYRGWFAGNVDRVVFAEKMVVSHKYRYAGTADLLAVMKGDTSPALIDIKCTGGFWPTMPLQLAGYREAILEEGEQVNRRLIVRLDKGQLGLQVKEYTEHTRDFNAFLCALGLFRYLNI